MKKICLLIGEGTSERYFFPKILEKKSFVSRSPKEGQLSIYNKGDVYWFFAYPPHFGTDVSGQSRLRKPQTYNLASIYVNNHDHLYGGGDLHLIALFDTDGSSDEEKMRAIKNAISESRIVLAKQIISPVHVEIESWYFAGLDINFPYFINKDSELEKLLSSKTSPKHTKENFLKYIDMNQMIGAKDIAQAVAEHFDERKALTLSVSFQKFLFFVEENNLY